MIPSTGHIEKLKLLNLKMFARKITAICVLSILLYKGQSMYKYIHICIYRERENKRKEQEREKGQRTYLKELVLVGEGAELLPGDSTPSSASPSTDPNAS